MSFVIFSTICLLAVIYFTVMPKNLYAIELAMILFVVVFVDSNWMDLAILNLHRFKLPDSHSEIFSFYCTFTILYPLIVGWSIDRISSLKQSWLKILIAVFSIFLITILETLTRYLNVITYLDWSWQWSLFQWLVIWLFSFIIHQFFRKLIVKELK
ncbi:hypothetical protein [Bacillus rubiinfantis]|uniref:hypothetical protein n=1 Tax=Bacillus rubiinfantis TaxID=1499680 RepID=UPI0005A76694|nr:hypothetical protein [Bacillus rubiinfantis]